MSPGSFSLTLDNNAPYDIDFPAPDQVQCCTPWYQTPTLNDDQHTVSLSNVASDFDYALVTAGETTPFEGTTIVVDDDDSEIVYRGTWTRNEELLNTPGLPFANATHRSVTVGSSISFEFFGKYPPSSSVGANRALCIAGTSIQVFGVNLVDATGTISILFELGGKGQTNSFPSPHQTPQPFDIPNTRLFASNLLDPGNHTLTATLTSVTGNRPFILDYILYKPSFDSLATKPNFHSSKSSSAPSTDPSETSSSVTTSSSLATPPSIQTASVPPRVIGGAAAGGILLLVLSVVLCFWIFIKRRRLRSRPPSTTPFELRPRPSHSNFFSCPQTNVRVPTVLII